MSVGAFESLQFGVLICAPQTFVKTTQVHGMKFYFKLEGYMELSTVSNCYLLKVSIVSMIASENCCFGASLQARVFAFFHT